MPADAYLNTFETNPIAAQCLFFVRDHSWVCLAERDKDFNNLTAEEIAHLKVCFDDEAAVDAATAERCVSEFNMRMGPGQVRGCGCCGFADVPTDDGKVRHGIMTFVRVWLPDEMLQVLAFTAKDDAHYDGRCHVTPEDKARWLRYRKAISMVEVNGTRLHLIPELCLGNEATNRYDEVYGCAMVAVVRQHNHRASVLCPRG